MSKPDWKEYSEFVALVAIIVSLVVLIVEVRENTQAIERQAGADRAAALAVPFFEADLAPILSKIHSVDGYGNIVSTYMDVYELTPEEAILWARHLIYLWDIYEAEFSAEGESEELRTTVRGLLRFRDNQIFVEFASRRRFAPDFREFVEEQRESLENASDQAQ